MLFEFILIRHAETEYNRAGRIQGSLDSPLTPEGREETSRLAQALLGAGGRIERWFVSPQGRARETSAILRAPLADALPAEEQHADLVEIRCGAYEGVLHSEIPAAETAALRSSPDARYPDGESARDVYRRCERFLDYLRKDLASARSGARVVLVSHGNLLRCMGAALLQQPAELAMRWKKDNTAVSRFVTRDLHAPMRLYRWNDLAHLSGGNPFLPSADD
jgi:probable phosphoglycerate mutase